MIDWLKDRLILFNGWVKAKVLNNCLAILPNLNKKQLNTIQTASNAGIGAVFDLTTRGYADLPKIRGQWKIPCVREVAKIAPQMATWKEQPKSHTMENCPITRASTRGDINNTFQQRWLGKIVKNKILRSWNDLSPAIREEIFFTVPKGKYTDKYFINYDNFFTCVWMIAISTVLCV